ncbi:unnamed protein product [Caenorhabditis bovis]|uniref:Uncharacterized protein n=1 Tax=Caenorhabditis bovis TaxID=2654633 RepID=A0A8S1EP86_9PELO|nr:unnamed protein product [Caenorhabditis bovis]
MTSMSRGGGSRVLIPLLYIILAHIRGIETIAKNFVNSSTPHLRPTFVVNFDTSTVICQHSADPNDLHIHNMSSLCDGKQDCFANPAMHDEVFPYCERKCESTCSGNGACLYDGTKPMCYCDSGYSGKACELQDKNECLDHPCHMMAQCQNTLSSYECRCLPGYTGNGTDCTDIDECVERTASCPDNSQCINLPGTFYCNCTHGFSPRGNQGAGLDKCVDINECETNTHDCESDEMCENTIGSFKCVKTCSPGYTLVNETACVDIDECASGDLHKCDSRADCINTIGGYTCECDEGFVGDGKNCQPKGSCSKNPSICDRHAYCLDKMELCVCSSGYAGDGITCYDVDECDALESPCKSGGRCLNLDGGYVCCKDGDSDEQCVKDQGAFCSGGCGLNAICANQTCQCVEGFSGDANKKCVDINECEDDKKCGGVGDRCVNLQGGFMCCQPGSAIPECNDQALSIDSSTISNNGADFTTTGEAFIESAGSIRNSSGGTFKVTRGYLPKNFQTTTGKLSCTSYCPANSECIDGYCECSKGYGGNALVGCEDIDECITETCNLEENEWCVNLIGSFVCCNPQNATHDDCLGLEISSRRGLQIIGGNEEDKIVAAVSNRSSSDQLITEVVQQSKNFSSGQVILTRGRVNSGESVIQTTADEDKFGLEISGSGIIRGSKSKEVEETGSGKQPSSGIWTEDGDESDEDEDLMGSGNRETTISGTGFTSAPTSEGTIRVRITTLGEETSEGSTKSPLFEKLPIDGSGSEVFESGSSGHFEKGEKVTFEQKSWRTGGADKKIDDKDETPTVGNKPGDKSETDTESGEGAGKEGEGSKSKSGEDGGKPEITTTDKEGGEGVEKEDGKPGSGKEGGEKPGSGKEGGEKPESGKEGGEKPESGKEGGEKPGSGKEGGEKPGSGKEGGEKPGAGDKSEEGSGKGTVTTTDSEGGEAVGSEGGKGTSEHGSHGTKEEGLEIKKVTEKPTNGDKIGLEISWNGKSTTPVPEVTIDSEKIGLEISGSGSTKKPSEGSGDGDDLELTGTTRDGSKFTKKPTIEIDGQGPNENEGVDGLGKTTKIPKDKKDEEGSGESSTPKSTTKSGEDGIPGESVSTESTTPKTTKITDEPTGIVTIGSTEKPEESTGPTTEGSGESTTESTTVSPTTVEGSGETTTSSESTIATSEGTTPSTKQTEGSGDTTTTASSAKPDETTEGSGETTTEGTEKPDGPSTKKPEESTPSTKKPEESTPSTKKPEESTPSTKKPEESTPSTKKPEESTPSTKKPEESTPSTKKPEESTPSTKKPEESTPSTKKPEESTPSTKKPEESTPSSENPDGSEKSTTPETSKKPEEVTTKVTEKPTIPATSGTTENPKGSTEKPEEVTSESTKTSEETTSPSSKTTDRSGESTTPTSEISNKPEESTESTIGSTEVSTTTSSGVTEGSGESEKPDGTTAIATESTKKPEESTPSTKKPEESTPSSENPDGSEKSTTPETSKKPEEVTTKVTEKPTIPATSGTTENPKGSTEKPEEVTSESTKTSEETTSPSSKTTDRSGESTTPTSEISNKPEESTESTIGSTEVSTTTSSGVTEGSGESEKPDGTTAIATESTKKPEETTPDGAETSSSVTSESTTPSTKATEATTTSKGSTTSDKAITGEPTTPISENATIIPNRETPTTKDTFILPTTTTIVPMVFENETTSENVKCTSSDECGNDALCERRTGVCRCEPGFEGTPPKTSCADVDECANGLHNCHATARCQNYVGGYACFCPMGYRKLDDGSCEDIDECKEHHSTCCGENAQCRNKPGGYTCECLKGFLGDGYHCVPNTKKPCEREQFEKSNCASNHACMVDEDGVVDCSECKNGYEKKDGVCVDVDECERMTSMCSPHSTCKNLNGTFSCACNEGFRGDGFICEDVNECEKHPCHPHADCTNLPGSFQCKCHSGFEGDGVKCTNPLERSCEDVQKFCGRVEHVSCLSVRVYNGSLTSVCECEPGYRFDKSSNECVDIDECHENRHNCDPASTVCVNTEGSFKCDCAEGYEGEGGICTDIDECDRGMAGCDSMAMCINRMGSCGCKCMAGYTGDGTQCTKIETIESRNNKCTDEWERLCELENKQCTVDEEEVPQCGACLHGNQPINGSCQPVQVSGLCKDNNDCSKHADCIDIQPNSHLCVCTPGFIGDGKICDDIDECSLNGMCDDENSKCENTMGAFKCVCKPGFEKSDNVCVALGTTTVVPKTNATIPIDEDSNENHEKKDGKTMSTTVKSSTPRTVSLSTPTPTTSSFLNVSEVSNNRTTSSGVVSVSSSTVLPTVRNLTSAPSPQSRSPEGTTMTAIVTSGIISNATPDIDLGEGVTSTLEIDVVKMTTTTMPLTTTTLHEVITVEETKNDTSTTLSEGVEPSTTQKPWESTKSVTSKSTTMNPTASSQKFTTSTTRSPKTTEESSTTGISLSSKKPNATASTVIMISSKAPKSSSEGTTVSTESTTISQKATTLLSTAPTESETDDKMSTSSSSTTTEASIPKITKKPEEGLLKSTTSKEIVTSTEPTTTSKPVKTTSSITTESTTLKPTRSTTNPASEVTIHSTTTETSLSPNTEPSTPSTLSVSSTEPSTSSRLPDEATTTAGPQAGTTSTTTEKATTLSVTSTSTTQSTKSSGSPLTSTSSSVQPDLKETTKPSKVTESTTLATTEPRSTTGATSEPQKEIPKESGSTTSASVESTTKPTEETTVASTQSTSTIPVITSSEEITTKNLTTTSASIETTMKSTAGSSTTEIPTSASTVVTTTEEIETNEEKSTTTSPVTREGEDSTESSMATELSTENPKLTSSVKTEKSGPSTLPTTISTNPAKEVTTTTASTEASTSTAEETSTAIPPDSEDQTSGVTTEEPSKTSTIVPDESKTSESSGTDESSTATTLREILSSTTAEVLRTTESTVNLEDRESTTPPDYGSTTTKKAEITDSTESLTSGGPFVVETTSVPATTKLSTSSEARKSTTNSLEIVTEAFTSTTSGPERLTSSTATTTLSEGSPESSTPTTSGVTTTTARESTTAKPLTTSSEIVTEFTALTTPEPETTSKVLTSEGSSTASTPSSSHQPTIETSTRSSERVTSEATTTESRKNESTVSLTTSSEASSTSEPESTIRTKKPLSEESTLTTPRITEETTTTEDVTNKHIGLSTESPEESRASTIEPEASTTPTNHTNPVSQISEVTVAPTEPFDPKASTTIVSPNVTVSETVKPVVTVPTSVPHVLVSSTTPIVPRSNRTRSPKPSETFSTTTTSTSTVSITTTSPTGSTEDLVIGVSSTTPGVAPPAEITTTTTTITTARVSVTANRGPPSISPPPSPTPTETTPLVTDSGMGGYGEEGTESTTTTSSTTTTTVSHLACANVKCHALAACDPSTGSCECREGFVGDGTQTCSKKSTADCLSLPSLCAEHAKCDNSTKSCECEPGYIGDGYICSPHPQDCVLRANLCSPEAICQNRRCQCLPGFTGDGIKCVSIHERASNCSQCDENAHCVGGTTCKCNPGYFGNGLCCVPDPLDCVHFTGICHPNAVCDAESRQCKCSSGFSGNGVSCFPHRSCRTDSSVCSTNAICLPTGSCICRHGFEGDGYTCARRFAAKPDLADVSSCATPCDEETQLCISGECICKQGFRTVADSAACQDVDECKEGTHDCDKLATCQNTIGSHVCSCPPGYVGDGTTCVKHVNNGKLSVYCEADGMTLVLGNETSDFEGRIFVKGQAENPHCSKSFSSLLNSQKPYVFKVEFQHCDVQHLENHTMASTVIVQKHAMFLTNKADSYDLRCQYPIGSRNVESHVNVSELATSSTLTDKNSELAPTCKLSVTNHQQVSISSATVGDTLKLSLEVLPGDHFGILPKNCFAVNIESGERYTLTDPSGCAIDESLFPQWSVVESNKVQAVFRTFKWPDSSMIRFQCDCSPCVDHCPTPKCIEGPSRFRRHTRIVNEAVNEELVPMEGVESLAVSSIISVQDSADGETNDDEATVLAESAPKSSDVCMRLAPILVAVVSFLVCSIVLIYLCSKKTKRVDSLPSL